MPANVERPLILVLLTFIVSCIQFLWGIAQRIIVGPLHVWLKYICAVTDYVARTQLSGTFLRYLLFTVPRFVTHLLAYGPIIALAHLSLLSYGSWWLLHYYACQDAAACAQRTLSWWVSIFAIYLLETILIWRGMKALRTLQYFKRRDLHRGLVLSFLDIPCSVLLIVSIVLDSPLRHKLHWAGLSQKCKDVAPASNDDSAIVLPRAAGHRYRRLCLQSFWFAILDILTLIPLILMIVLPWRWSALAAVRSRSNYSTLDANSAIASQAIKGLFLDIPFFIAAIVFSIIGFYRLPLLVSSLRAATVEDRHSICFEHVKSVASDIPYILMGLVLLITLYRFHPVFKVLAGVIDEQFLKRTISSEFFKLCMDPFMAISIALLFLTHYRWQLYISKVASRKDEFIPYHTVAIAQACALFCDAIVIVPASLPIIVTLWRLPTLVQKLYNSEIKQLRQTALRVLAMWLFDLLAVPLFIVLMLTLYRVLSLWERYRSLTRPTDRIPLVSAEAAAVFVEFGSFLVDLPHFVLAILALHRLPCILYLAVKVHNDARSRRRATREQFVEAWIDIAFVLCFIISVVTITNLFSLHLLVQKRKTDTTVRVRLDFIKVTTKRLLLHILMTPVALIAIVLPQRWSIILKKGLQECNSVEALDRVILRQAIFGLYDVIVAPLALIVLVTLWRSRELIETAKENTILSSDSVKFQNKVVKIFIRLVGDIPMLILIILSCSTLWRIPHVRRIISSNMSYWRTMRLLALNVALAFADIPSALLLFVLLATWRHHSIRSKLAFVWKDRNLDRVNWVIGAEVLQLLVDMLFAILALLSLWRLPWVISAVYHHDSAKERRLDVLRGIRDMLEDIPYIIMALIVLVAVWRLPAALHELFVRRSVPPKQAIRAHAFLAIEDVFLFIRVLIISYIGFHVLDSIYRVCRLLHFRLRKWLPVALHKIRTRNVQKQTQEYNGQILPEEMLQEIFSFSSDSDLVHRQSLVCKHWSGLIIQEDVTIWKPRFDKLLASQSVQDRLTSFFHVDDYRVAMLDEKATAMQRYAALLRISTGRTYHYANEVEEDHALGLREVVRLESLMSRRFFFSKIFVLPWYIQWLLGLPILSMASRTVPFLIREGKPSIAFLVLNRDRGYQRPLEVTVMRLLASVYTILGILYPLVTLQHAPVFLLGRLFIKLLAPKNQNATSIPKVFMAAQMLHSLLYIAMYIAMVFLPLYYGRPIQAFVLQGFDAIITLLEGYRTYISAIPYLFILHYAGMWLHWRMLSWGFGYARFMLSYAVVFFFVFAVIQFFLHNMEVVRITKSLNRRSNYWRPLSCWWLFAQGVYQRAALPLGRFLNFLIARVFAGNMKRMVKLVWSKYANILAVATQSLYKLGRIGDLLLIPVAICWFAWPLLVAYMRLFNHAWAPAIITTAVFAVQARKIIMFNWRDTSKSKQQQKQ